MISAVLGLLGERRVCEVLVLAGGSAGGVWKKPRTESEDPRSGGSALSFLALGVCICKGRLHLLLVFTRTIALKVFPRKLRVRQLRIGLVHP